MILTRCYLSALCPDYVEDTPVYDQARPYWPRGQGFRELLIPVTEVVAVSGRRPSSNDHIQLQGYVRSAGFQRNLRGAAG